MGMETGMQTGIDTAFQSSSQDKQGLQATSKGPDTEQRWELSSHGTFPATSRRQRGQDSPEDEGTVIRRVICDLERGNFQSAPR